MEAGNIFGETSNLNAKNNKRKWVADYKTDSEKNELTKHESQK
jgi:hypothetical protein